MQPIKVSEAAANHRTVLLHLVDETDHFTPVTGESGGQPQISKVSAAYANSTNTLIEIGNGTYALVLATAECDMTGPLSYRYKSANTDEFVAAVLIVSYDPYSATSLGLSNLDAAVSSRSSHSAADVWAAGTRTLTGFGTLIADIWANVSRTITGGTLTTAPPTAVQNADALLGRVDGVETGVTPQGAFRLMLSALAGKLSGAGTTTITIRNTADTKDRIAATVDADGNRSAITTDVT